MLTVLKTEGWRGLNDQSIPDGSAHHDALRDQEVTPGKAQVEKSSPAQGSTAPGKKRGRVSSAVVFCVDLYGGYSRRNGSLLSAGISFYVLFALGPLAWITVQLAGRILGHSVISPSDRISSALEPYLGQQLSDVLAGLFTTVRDPASYSFGLVGLAILVFGAIRLYLRLQDSFNIMWDTRIVSKQLSRERLLHRLVVFGVLLIPTILVVLASVLGSAFSWLGNLMHVSGPLLVATQIGIPLVLGWLALLAVFVILPDIHLSWRDCWPGALVVAVAWRIGTFGFGLYLSWSGGTKYTGPVGAFLGLILWVFIMAVISLLGVRLNKVIYVRRGKVIRPYDYAAPITELPDGSAVLAPPEGQGARASGPRAPRKGT
jgi:membrane protein